MSYFSEFLTWFMKTLENDRQEIKISTRMKKFHFWVKYAVFSENENEILNNSDFCYTWSNDHIKYNNAKRSIPAHPTLFNDAHWDLHLWPVNSKINRVHPLTMVNMFVKFDE